MKSSNFSNILRGFCTILILIVSLANSSFFGDVLLTHAQEGDPDTGNESDISPFLSSSTVIFSDDFSGSYPGAWFIGHDGGAGGETWAWPISIFTYAHAIAEPGGSSYIYYPANLATYMERRGVSLAGYTSAILSFQRIVQTEANYDFFTVNVRDDYGTWHEMFSESGLATDDWTYTEVDLSSFAGQTNLYVQFRFDSDYSVNGDDTRTGVSIDTVSLVGGIDSCPDIGTPTYTSPVHDETISDNTPYFNWTYVSNNDGYQFQLYNETFSEKMKDVYASSSNYQYPDSLPDGTYYWRAKAYTDTTGCPDGEYSTFWSVHIDTSEPEISVKFNENGTLISDGDTTPSASEGTDFGSVAVSGGTEAHWFRVWNYGDADLILDGSPRVAVSGTHAGDFTVTSQPGSPIGGGGNSSQFEVTFNPSGTGVRTATISISNNDSDEDPYNFTIQGTGEGEPEISVKFNENGTLIPDGDSTPSASEGTDFGSVAVSGGTEAHWFRVWNYGDADLILDGSPRVVVSGTHAGDFTVTSQPGSPIGGGGNSSQFEVTFNPSGTGTRTATISISNNDSNEDPYNFTIQGTGEPDGEPEIAVKFNENGTLIPDGDSTPSTSDGTDFGTIAVSGGTEAHWFRIWNEGDANLILDGTPKVVIGGTHAGDFTVTSLPSSPIGGGYNSTQFEVTFNPSGVGVRTAAISIPNNDSNEDPYNFTIQGTGGSDPEPEISVRFNENGTLISDGDSTPSVSEGTDFGSVAVSGGTEAHWFRIWNDGDANLILDGTPKVVIGGTHAGDFSVTSQPSSPIGGGGNSSQFEVTFNPSGTGVRTATISISNNDSNEDPYNFTIQGTGVVDVGDTVGQYDPVTSIFYLKPTNETGWDGVNSFKFGPPGGGREPITGNWDGVGDDTVGLFDPVTSFFYLKPANETGWDGVNTFKFGPPGGGRIPIAGDWNGNGTDTVGLYDPATSIFYLKPANETGWDGVITFKFGPPGGGYIPIAGNWDGVGGDTIGLYNPDTGIFYLKPANETGWDGVNAFKFGPAGGRIPIAGDWNGNGTDTIGLYAPATSFFYLKPANVTGWDGVNTFKFGPPGGGREPIAGDW